MTIVIQIANIYWAFSMCQTVFQSALYDNDYLLLRTVSVWKTSELSIVLASLGCYKYVY